jgi:hypothetical protein
MREDSKNASRIIELALASVASLVSYPDAFVKIAFRRPPPEENLFSLAGMKI